jgi:hypothetical protein
VFRHSEKRSFHRFGPQKNKSSHQRYAFPDSRGRGDRFGETASATTQILDFVTFSVDRKSPTFPRLARRECHFPAQRRKNSAPDAPFMPLVSGSEIDFPRLVRDAFAETGSLKGETGSTRRPPNQNLTAHRCRRQTDVAKSESAMKEAEARSVPFGLTECCGLHSCAQ